MQKHILLAMILAISFASTAFADKPAKGPHDGEVVAIPPYRVEFQIMEGMLHLYVSSEDNKPIGAKDVSGSVIIEFPDGKKTNAKLTTMGTALMGSAPISVHKPFIAAATLTIKNKSFTAKYSHKPIKTDKK